MNTTNEQLLNFLEKAHTCYQAVDEISRILKNQGYSELNESDVWELREGGRYFVTRNGSSIIAFRVPKKNFNGFMIGASHSDSPSFKIKENPEIISNGYVKLNVEGYGGMLMGPWLDRPLSVAGRLIVKDGNRYVTKLVDIDRDLLLIPNLAIHMNRNANKDQSWNVQTDLLPVLGSEKESKGSFMKIVAEAAGVSESDILGHDLLLYIRGRGTVWGAHDEYLSAGHLDDLQCGFGNMYGFLEARDSSSVPVLAIFDNEEVGSRTKQGADSTFLEDVLSRIASGCGKNEEEYHAAVADSFMVSADNAHAVHPNHPEKADPVNRPLMNEGIVIKYNAAQHYTTDGVSAAVFKDICNKADVPYQYFTKRSDSAGGSTLGNISNAHISIDTVDIGLAQLAMHSCYETCGTKDTDYLIAAMKKFFSGSVHKEKGGIIVRDPA